MTLFNWDSVKVQLTVLPHEEHVALACCSAIMDPSVSLILMSVNNLWTSSDMVFVIVLNLLLLCST